MALPCVRPWRRCDASYYRSSWLSLTTTHCRRALPPELLGLMPRYTATLPFTPSFNRPIG